MAAFCYSSRVVVHTVGHSTLPLADFLALLAAHDVRGIADVRRYPMSRRHPHFSRDPLARIVFLPADHYVRDERVLGASLRETARLLTRNFDSLALVGIEPEEADPELGYVLPGARHADGALGVERFVEKTESDQ